MNEKIYECHNDKDKLNHKIISNAIGYWSDTNTESERSIKFNISHVRK
jgi:hypothetical protein